MKHIIELYSSLYHTIIYFYIVKRFLAKSKFYALTDIKFTNNNNYNHCVNKCWCFFLSKDSFTVYRLFVELHNYSPLYNYVVKLREMSFQISYNIIYTAYTGWFDYCWNTFQKKIRQKSDYISSERARHNSISRRP